jgi:hypothetical protein
LWCHWSHRDIFARFLCRPTPALVPYLEIGVNYDWSSLRSSGRLYGVFGATAYFRIGELRNRGVLLDVGYQRGSIAIGMGYALGW